MKKGIVSTGSKEATQAGIEMLHLGGNAFDAAIASVFTSMTSEFALTGVGGGGSMMCHIKENTPIIYDFFVDTPPRLDAKELDFFGVDVDFGDSVQTFHVGKGSAAVPGTLLGLITVHEKHGVLPLSTILEPAIELAKEGVKLAICSRDAEKINRAANDIKELTNSEVFCIQANLSNKEDIDNP